jgi:hypothetical protein
MIYTFFMEEYNLKPISKKALIRCVEKSIHEPWRSQIMDLLKQKEFASVHLKKGEGLETAFLLQKALVSNQKAEEYTSYCGDSVWTAVCAVLDDDLTIIMLHALTFPNTVRI